MSINRELNDKLKDMVHCVEQAKIYLYNPFEVEVTEFNRKALKAWLRRIKMLVTESNKILSSK